MQASAAIATKRVKFMAAHKMLFACLCCVSWILEQVVSDCLTPESIAENIQTNAEAV